MTSLAKTFKYIRNDIPEQSLTFKSFIRNYIYSPRFRVLLNHRLGKYFFEINFFLCRALDNFYKVKLIIKRNCDISFNAQIGKNLKILHPIGIGIGDRVVLKDNVTIFQQVTFGSHGRNDVTFEYPVVENGAKTYAGAKIFEGVRIGENAADNIAAPTNAVTIGVLCKIIQE
jgi:serine O-acetyltransferase